MQSWAIVGPTSPSSSPEGTPKPMQDRELRQKYAVLPYAEISTPVESFRALQIQKKVEANKDKFHKQTDRGD